MINKWKRLLFFFANEPFCRIKALLPVYVCACVRVCAKSHHRWGKISRNWILTGRKKEWQNERKRKMVELSAVQFPERPSRLVPSQISNINQTPLLCLSRCLFYFPWFLSILLHWRQRDTEDIWWETETKKKEKVAHYLVQNRRCIGGKRRRGSASIVEKMEKAMNKWEDWKRKKTENKTETEEPSLLGVVYGNFHSSVMQCSPDYTWPFSESAADQCVS